MDWRKACKLAASKGVAWERYFAERAARADVPKALSVVKKAGAGRKPVKGDDVAG